MSSCCVSGFTWNGTPSGREEKINGLDVYVAGENKDVAILFLHDIFGWTFPNSRLLADHFAREVNASVYLPDFFGGEVITEDQIFDPEKFKHLDLQGYMARNNKEIRGPSIHNFARHMKD
ncbi:MAG: hypothetical protein Q9168_008396, partial [Polycauliona sp. 1 TL-2023]